MIQAAGLATVVIISQKIYNISYLNPKKKKKKKSLWNYNLSSKASLMIILKTSFCHKSNDTLKEPFT